VKGGCSPGFPVLVLSKARSSRRNPLYCKAICARTIPLHPTKIKNKFLHTTSLQTPVCKDVVFVK